MSGHVKSQNEGGSGKQKVIAWQSEHTRSKQAKQGCPLGHGRLTRERPGPHSQGTSVRTQLFLWDFLVFLLFPELRLPPRALS